MITKAGVPSNKVVVGVPSYGRSFHMSQAGCTGVMCTFTGTANHSDAAKGPCTDTAGYIANAEIEDIILQGNVKQWTDQYSNFMVYNDTEWVAYMDGENNAARTALYDGYNMAGTTDWSVDLQSFEGDATFYNDFEEVAPCDATYSNLDDIAKDKDTIPGYCMDAYVLFVLANIFDKSLHNYDDIMAKGYDDKFGYFAKAVSQEWDADLYDFYHGDADQYYDCLEQANIGGDNYENRSIACPPNYISGYAFSIYFILKDEKKLADYLDKTYQIDISWVGTDLRFVPCNTDDENICKMYGRMIGAPGLKPGFEVPNPKDSVGKSVENLRALPPFLRVSADKIRHGIFGDDDSLDAVDSAAVPAFMVQAAIDQMNQIYDAGAEIEKKERENIIIMALTAFLFILPGLGEALGVVTGIAMFARLAAPFSPSWAGWPWDRTILRRTTTT